MLRKHLDRIVETPSLLGTVLNPESIVWTVNAVQNALPDSWEELETIVGEDKCFLLKELFSVWETEAEERRRRRTLIRMVERTSNRLQYGYISGLRWKTNEQGGRWMFDRLIRGRNSFGYLVDGVPSVHPLMNDTIADIPDQQIGNLFSAEMLMVRGKWLVKVGSPEWELAVKCFPKAIDFAAYFSGLCAPVLPDGHWEQEVQIRRIPGTDGQDLGSDGAGRCHPSIVERMGSGLGCIQIRGVGPGGFFCKGILVPDERCGTEENPEVWIHPSQIKGRCRARAKEVMANNETATITVRLSVIQQWSTPSDISWGFEVLENIETNDTSKEICRQFVEEAFSELMNKDRGGIWGLARSAVRDSLQGQTLLKLLLLAYQQEVKLKGSSAINPLQVPFLNDIIRDHIAKILYRFTTGSGMSAERFVLVLDNSVEPGTAVLDGFRPGEQLALFRWPVVTSQVLTTVKVATPQRHHLVGNQIVPYTIFLNPIDGSAHLMGDDDGDTVAVTKDPRALKLWSMLVENQRVLIENSGVPLDLRTADLTDEVRDYIAYDQRGPVGQLTLMRSRLLAAGLNQAALCCSVLIQAAIDRAKKKMLYLNPNDGLDRDNWIRKGRFLVPNWTTSAPLDEDGELDIREVRRWVNGLLMESGCPTEMVETEDGRLIEKPLELLTWRQITEEGNSVKKILFESWGPTPKEIPENFRNLVHHCNDLVYSKWQSIKDELLSHQRSIETESMLADLLPEIEFEKPSWDEYDRGLRKKAGIRRFAASFVDALKEDNIAVRTTKKENAKAKLYRDAAALTVSEMMTIWWCEHHYCGKGPNPIWAQEACCWDGSPLLAALGIQDDKCRLMTREIVDRVVAMCLKENEPLARLETFLSNNRTHAEKVSDESGPVPLWACQHCRDTLEHGLVRAIRDDAGRAEHQQMKELLVRLK